MLALDGGAMTVAHVDIRFGGVPARLAALPGLHQTTAKARCSTGAVQPDTPRGRRTIRDLPPQRDVRGRGSPHVASLAWLKGRYDGQLRPTWPHW